MGVFDRNYMKKKIAILGSTGSIGKSTIEIIKKDKKNFKVVLLTSHKNTKELDKQRLPKWFNGELYDEGATVQNRFSGEKYELNNVELSMYDFVMGATMCMEMGMPCNVTDLRRGLDWFRKNNAEAYMILLD